MSVSSESNFNYKVGGSLDVNYPNYIVRKADLDIYKSLEKGEYCYVFNGRQTGKSSLRIRTAERLKKAEFVCVEIDLMAIVGEGSNVGQIYAGIVQEIASGLLLEVDCLSWWLERENLEPQECLIEFIEQVIFTEFEKNIVIFIDEVDYLRVSDLSLEVFLGLIQSFYQKRESNPAYQRLTFALFGVVEISDFSHILIGNKIELAGDPEFISWLESRVETSVDPEERVALKDLLDMIVDITTRVKVNQLAEERAAQEAARAEQNRLDEAERIADDFTVGRSRRDACCG